MADNRPGNSPDATETIAQGWSSYQLQIYSSRRPPALGTVSLIELEDRAKEALREIHPGDDAFDYVAGSAGTGATQRANRRAFQEWQIVPRMLRNATVRDIKTTIFGKTYPSPVILGPIGVQGIMHQDAESATARAASKLGVPFVLSTAGTRSIETVAKESGEGPRWFQLYWPKSDDITISLLKRAKENRYTTLVVTLDTMILGWRPRDLNKSYLPFIHGVGAQVGFSDPVFSGRFSLPPTYDSPAFPYNPEAADQLLFTPGVEGDGMRRLVRLSTEWLKEANSGVFRTWDDLPFLRKHWEGPILLKGIQSVDDALKAVEVGIDGIVISNHGGRQVDGAIASLNALEKICSTEEVQTAQQSGFTVLFDSGIRTGSDIIKAIALGAQGVLIGRPYMYGLALGGQEGVEHVIRSLLCDLEVNMALSGYSSLSEIRGRANSVLQKVNDAGCVLSVF